MASTINVRNRTKLPDPLLYEFIRCAESFVRLPLMTKVHLCVSWGKSTHGQAAYSMNGREVWVKIRICRGKKQLTGVELALSAFLVIVHELFHAHEYMSGKAPTMKGHGRWENRPHEQRAMLREGGAALVILLSPEGAEARNVIGDMAAAFCKLGVVFA